MTAYTLRLTLDVPVKYIAWLRALQLQTDFAQELLARMQNLSADMQRLRGDWSGNTQYRSWNACPTAAVIKPSQVGSYK